MFAPARVPLGRGRYFLGASNGENMSKKNRTNKAAPKHELDRAAPSAAAEQYLLEIQNTSPNLIVVTCPAKAPLMLTPASNGPPARVALTSEQFLSMAYDLEGFIDGTHGVTKSLTLWVTDLDSGRCEACPFEAGRMIASGGFSADANAEEEQQEQEAEIEAKRQAILDKAKADANAGNGSLAGSVQAGLNTLA